MLYWTSDCIKWGILRPSAGHLNKKILSYQFCDSHYKDKINGLVQEQRQSIDLAMEFCLFLH